MSAIRLLLSLTLAATIAFGQQYVISTYAGGAPTPTPVLGTIASISSLGGVAVDALGNVYIASNNCVFKLDQGGILTRVAGNSRNGYTGDGGPATSAQLNAGGVAVDKAGNLYIADGGNYRIRKVTPAGTISTIAGTGVPVSSGDGGPAINAALFPSAVAV